MHASHNMQKLHSEVAYARFAQHMHSTQGLQVQHGATEPSTEPADAHIAQRTGAEWLVNVQQGAAQHG